MCGHHGLCIYRNGLKLWGQRCHVGHCEEGWGCQDPLYPQASGPRGPVSGSSLPCAQVAQPGPVFSRPPARPPAACPASLMPMWGDRDARAQPGLSPLRPPSPPDIRDPGGGRAGLGSTWEAAVKSVQAKERNPSLFVRKPTGTEDQTWVHGDRRDLGDSPSPRPLPPLSQGGPAGRLSDPGASWGCPDLCAPGSFTATLPLNHRAAPVLARFPREVPGSDFSGS